MRYLIVATLLFLSACSANSHYSSPRQVTHISDLYAARDACLRQNAVPHAGEVTDTGTIARAVSLSCQHQIDDLVVASNPSNDPVVTAAIRRDSEFRATGYVMRARGETGYGL